MTEKTALYQSYVNDYLKNFIDSYQFPDKQLKKAIKYVLFPGGKRFRPLLVYLSGVSLGLPQHTLNVIAAAIEIIHSYSLVHDDLPAMDDDALRRGKPTCHIQFDESTAILVGDGLQALAFELLLAELPRTLEPSQVVAITHELANASGFAGMVSGQSLDLSRLHAQDVSLTELALIHGLKTGKLISACINMVLHACPEYGEKECLRSYAKHLGLAFQIQDDYLDCYATTQQLGKQQGSDQVNEKITFASVYSQEQLAKLIEETYTTAISALEPCNSLMKELINFTEQLRLRTF